MKASSTDFVSAPMMLGDRSGFTATSCTHIDLPIDKAVVGVGFHGIAGIHLGIT
jgi:hypothetical protein